MVFSSLVADHVQRPRNIGPLEGASYGVSGEPGEGPYLEIWVKVEGGKVINAAYKTHGCPSSIASGSMLCELIKGREVEKAMLIKGHDLELILGGLPEGKGHFATMAVDAMKQAIDKAAVKK